VRDLAPDSDLGKLCRDNLTLAHVCPASGTPTQRRLAAPQDSPHPAAHAPQGPWAAAFLPPMRPTLTVAEVRALCDWTTARARWWVQRWEAQGYPLVTRVPCKRRGGFRYAVDRAECEAWLAGRPTEHALPEAA
jgi:hypothetical protein